MSKIELPSNIDLSNHKEIEKFMHFSTIELNRNDLSVGEMMMSYDKEHDTRMKNIGFKLCFNAIPCKDGRYTLARDPFTWIHENSWRE